MIETNKKNKKVYDNAAEALFDLQSGMTLMSGGFGLCGIAENSIAAIAAMPIKDLTVISNNVGNSGRGLVALLRNKQIRKAYCSYVGGNPDLEQQMLAKEIDVELVPQGTLCERIRAAGLGIRGFYTPTGYGTTVAEGKETKMFDKPCILELPLHADFSIIKAQRGDTFGNLWFKESARNFSPLEELVPMGEIPPEDVHLPGIFVQRIFQGSHYRNDIEILILARPDANRSEVL